MKGVPTDGRRAQGKRQVGHAAAWQDIDVVSVGCSSCRMASDLTLRMNEVGHPGEVPRLRYPPDPRDAVEVMARGEAEIAILVRPTTVSQVCAVADAGGRMPSGSTHSCPKPAAGLVLNRVDGDA